MQSPTLHEALIDYRRAMIAANVPDGTVKQYTMIIRRLSGRYAERRFAGITTTDLADFLYGKQGILVGLGAGTGTTYRCALRSFFAYGRLTGWTKTETVVPAPVFRPRKATPYYAPTRLTESELLSMLDRADHPLMRGMVAVGIGTALRISDIRKIRVTDVDFTTGDLYVWVQKTGRFDAMPISLDLDEELRRYLAWLPVPGEYLFPGWSPRNEPGTGHLYYVPDPSKHVSYAWSSERLHRLFESCGIRVEPREAWHVIRRSVARLYFDRLRGEVSHDHALRQTSALLGHLNSETTERYLGLQAEVRARNESLKGRRFLSAGVVPIRKSV